MKRASLALFLCLMLLPFGASGYDYRRWPDTLPDQAHAGFGSMNDLVGAHVEIANPIGSVYLLVGGHLRGLDVDDWEEGGAAGFAAGFRFFSNGNGLQSSWYVTGFGGTLGVERRREQGRRVGYQRLGWGGGIGYQHVLSRGRLGFTLGVGQLESVDTADGERVDREFVPMLETTMGLRF